MASSKNIVFGALSGALAASAVLIAANAVMPSTAWSLGSHSQQRANTAA